MLNKWINEEDAGKIEEIVRTKSTEGMPEVKAYYLEGKLNLLLEDEIPENGIPTYTILAVLEKLPYEIGDQRFHLNKIRKNSWQAEYGNAIVSEVYTEPIDAVAEIFIHVLAKNIPLEE